MILPLSTKLLNFAEILPKPLYVVGGYVRNFLIDKYISSDIDLSSALRVEEILPYVEKSGLKVIGEYKRTNTLLLSDGDNKYEFTSFRCDVYSKGHTPVYTTHTDDIKIDAIRRDFKCNAVYYDIKNQKIVDPLGGVEDIKNRVIDTVLAPEIVFGVDGLRLMRLARFSAELGFTVKEEVLLGAKLNADKIKDISAERIYTELKKILLADEKYPFSPKNAHYNGLKVLDETRVLDRIIPELTLGRGMIQRADYHDYDVLQHSLLTVLYARSDNRISALLHDVGKPYCMNNFGRYKLHDFEGENIAVNILKRLKADKKQIKESAFIVKYHMAGVKKELDVSVMRCLLAQNKEYAEKLIDILKADSMAGKNGAVISSSALRWEELYNKMLSDGTPFTARELNIKPKDLKSLGVEDKKLGETINNLLRICQESPEKNQKSTLIEIVKKLQEK